MLTSQTASMVDTDSKFEIALVMPEENLILSATSAENKMEWFVNLQKCILHVLGMWRSLFHILQRRFDIYSIYCIVFAFYSIVVSVKVSLICVTVTLFSKSESTNTKTDT